MANMVNKITTSIDPLYQDIIRNDLKVSVPRVIEAGVKALLEERERFKKLLKPALNKDPFPILNMCEE